MLKLSQLQQRLKDIISNIQCSENQKKRLNAVIADADCIAELLEEVNKIRISLNKGFWRNALYNELNKFFLNDVGITFHLSPTQLRYGYSVYDFENQLHASIHKFIETYSIPMNNMKAPSITY